MKRPKSPCARLLPIARRLPGGAGRDLNKAGGDESPNAAEHRSSHGTEGDPYDTRGLLGTDAAGVLTVTTSLSASPSDEKRRPRMPDDPAERFEPPNLRPAE